MAEDVPGPGRGPEPAPAAVPESLRPAAVGRRGRRRLVGTLAAAGFVVVAAGVVTVAGWLPGPPGSGPDRTGDRGRQTAPARTGLAELPCAPGSPAPGQPFPPPGGGQSSAPSGAPRPDGGSPPPAGASGTPPVPTDLAPAPPGPTGPTTFAGLAGPGCPAATGATAVTGGWARASGGWTGDGCDGTALTHTSSAAGTDAVTWRFDVPVAGTCLVEVYVPAGAAAPEALYDVVRGGDVGGFAVDQRDSPGRWVTGGSFRAAAGPFRVRLTDRGDGRSSVAAASLRLRCH